MPLKPPPRDNNGLVPPHNHEDIASDHGVIRRVSYEQTVQDADGNRRLSTMAFEPSSEEHDPYRGLSVDLEQSIIDARLDAKSFVTTPKYLGSVRYTADQVRQNGLQLGFDPIEATDDTSGNPHHGEIWGATAKSKKKKLLQMATWFVQLPDVYIP